MTSISKKTRSRISPSRESNPRKSPSRNSKLRASGARHSQFQILWKKAVEARGQWPALLRRPPSIWLLLRNTLLQHAILISALVGISFLSAPLFAGIGEAADWIFAGRVLAVFVWGLSIWLSTPKILHLATLRAQGIVIQADHRAKEDPQQGLKLYREALAQTVSSHSRSNIERKIRAIESTLSGEIRATQANTPRTTSKTSSSPCSRNDATIVKQVAPPRSNDDDSEVESVGPDGRYVIHRELGRGGMAVVFLASDKVLGRDVALKQLPTQMYSEKELTERFRQEARALASLSHSNVVQIFDLFDHDEQLWIAMEFVSGGDLADQMDERGAYSAHDALEIIVPVARGLAAAHARGIIHRDIKPMNILLAEDLTPKLTDFGLAKLIESSVHTVAGVAMGSPPYMSPEQAAGKPADKATDMYSLGITLYELLSGRTPFEGDTTQVMAQHITQAPAPLTDLCPDLAPEVSEFVIGMLGKDPSVRPSDMNRWVARAEALGVLR